VIASDGRRNLKSAEKARAIQRFFPKGFDYAGNSQADIPVWRDARKAVVVGGSDSVMRQIGSDSKVEAAFSTKQEPRLRVWARALRVHQWLKNLLVFVPVVTSHRWNEPGVLVASALMAAALSLIASSLYIFNDLLDLEADRQHPRKRSRPLASGAMSVPQGAVIMFLAFFGGLMLASVTGPWTLVLAGIYAMTSVLYSLKLKTQALVDVFFLAMLYVLRIVAGGAAIHILVTNWLLAFALFLFLGLALCKRAVELIAIGPGSGSVKGRDYGIGDLGLVTTCGIASAFTTTLVLVLYLDSDQVRIMYRNPVILWLFAPLVLFWQIRFWLLTSRGQMHDDPVSFAAADRVTWLVAGAALALMLVAMNLQ
jgi:4-hydroxybenzoate polyprenyltransferase